MSHEYKLSGQFVDLRPLSKSDARLTLAWRTAHRARLLNAGASTVKEQEEWISSRPTSEINFIIDTKESIPVGMLSLVAIDKKNLHAESARFLIGEEAAVKGLPVAVESMKLLYELAFDGLGLQRIYGTVASENTLMIKWQKYLGMQEEGRLRKHYFIDGKWQDAVILGLLIDEARKFSIPRMNGLIASAIKIKS